MIIESNSDLKVWREKFSHRRLPSKKSILMVHPYYFDVDYAINPHMMTCGNLNQVDRNLALRQWQTLKETFEKLDLSVHVLAGTPEFPDMVFCANQSLPFWDFKRQKPSAVLSQMRHPQRRGEVPYIQRWLECYGYNTYQLSDDRYSFEGCGDAISLNDQPVIFGGFGFRSHVETYEEISQLTHYSIIPIELASEEFYHLDTCLFVIDDQTVAVVKEAITNESFKRITQFFEKVILVDPLEAIEKFAGNCFCVNEKLVLMPSGCFNLKRQLEKNGIETQFIDTSEFIKAGGSIFCMKLHLF